MKIKPINSVGFLSQSFIDEDEIKTQAEYDYDSLSIEWTIIYTMTLTMSLVAVIPGIFGNIMVIRFFKYARPSSTTTNHYLISIAVSDIVLNMAEIVWSISDLFIESILESPERRRIYYIVSSFAEMSTNLSDHVTFWTLLWITYIRYQGIVKKVLRLNACQSNVKMVNTIIWTSFLVIWFPFSLMHTYTKFNSDSMNSSDTRIIRYIISFGLILYLLLINIVPFVFIAYMISKICAVLWSRKRPGHVNPEQREVDLNIRKRQITLLITLVVGLAIYFLFRIWFLGTILLYFLNIFDDSVTKTNFYRIFILLFRIGSILYRFINPIVYFVFYPDLREQLYNLIPFRKKRNLAEKSNITSSNLGPTMSTTLSRKESNRD